MKPIDQQILMVSGIAAFYIWWAGRRPYLKFEYSQGTVPGINYQMGAFGKKVTGFRPFIEGGIESFVQGAYNFVVESIEQGIVFTIYNSEGKNIFSRVVDRTPETP